MALSYQIKSVILQLVKTCLYMIKITFPDGVVKEFESGITPLQIAEGISPQFKKEIVACAINGKTTELNTVLTEDATIKFFKFENRFELMS